MKKIYFSFLFVLLALFPSFSQTKLIAHKSHSGSDSDFATALTNNLFDLAASDFGMVPMETIKTARLDSLIFISDSVSIMVTSEVCIRRRLGDLEKQNGKVWKAGKDTIHFHPLFRFQHAKDSIKQVLDSLYNFQNPADSVVFIGYDNQKVKPVPIMLEVISVSKKAHRKAKKRQKKLERKMKKVQKKQAKKKPVIKPAVFLPINQEVPKDPPAHLIPLKLGLVMMTLFLSLILGFIYKRSRLIRTTKAY